MLNMDYLGLAEAKLAGAVWAGGRRAPAALLEQACQAAKYWNCCLVTSPSLTHAPALVVARADTSAHPC